MTLQPATNRTWRTGAWEILAPWNWTAPWSRDRSRYFPLCM